LSVFGKISNMQHVVPMIHVPDVRRTVEWYQRIGFTLRGTNEPDGVMDWAALVFVNSEVMFTEGGRASTEDRREVDLYVRVEDVDAVYQRLKDWTEVRVELNDTFYGMREFIIRDINGFWITFGQEMPDEQASTSV